MSNKAFDIIRFLSEVAITAVGALYYALAETWGWPYGEAIVASCAAISSFVGIFTEWQRKSYNKTERSEDDGEDC